jgi:EpsD family peptidyl-prolyl cis-trans isomerase
MKRMLRSLFPLLIIALPAVTACSEKKPEGQVVAVVDGEEITIAELNHEAEAQGAGNPSQPAVREAMLQQIIDRKLLASQAAEKGLDRSSDYLLASRRSNETLLASLLMRKVVGTEEPYEADIEAFANKNPMMFAQRRLFVVDQLEFGRPEDPALGRRIEAAKSVDEMEALLAAAGVTRQRSQKTWDSAELPAELTKKLMSLGTGEPFVIVSADPLIAGQVVSSSAAPVPAKAQRALAAQGLKQERSARSVEAWLENSRKGADIKYQKGFEPRAAGARDKQP